MAREKFKTLTEQMYYVLIALQEERCGVDVMEVVREMTNQRIKLGPGTLYSLLGDFQREGFMKETTNSGSKRRYSRHSKHTASIQRNASCVFSCKRRRR